MKEAYEKILDEYKQNAELLAIGGGADIAKIGKRQAELQPTVDNIKKLEKLEKDLTENEKLLSDEDKEIRDIAAQEVQILKAKILNLKSRTEEALLPRDPLDNKNVIAEIRAAAGGDEASLFAAELFRMYARFAESQDWQVTVLSSSRSEVAGFKEIICEIRGREVYGHLKYESGVHRVQRVPKTEKSGRVHTSTVTVAVLPQVEEDEFKINPTDLKIETSTSRGAGGQSVNTTYSAVRITHLPTGIMAQSQDERSQLQNRQRALKVLTARVFSCFEEQKQKELSQKRRRQIGTGDRSEKIRTYNFPQDRVTDHRLNKNWNQIDLIMDGKLGPIIETLIAEDQKRQINS